MAAGKKNLDYLRRCRSRIHGAQHWRKREGLDELWDRLNDLYRGKHFPEPLGNEDRIAVNIAFSTINIVGPSIAVNHPKITVGARIPEHEDRALIVETVINYWWRTYEIRPEFRDAVKDYLIFGFGWLKTGYRFVEEEQELPAEDVEAERQEVLGQLDDFAMEFPDLAGDLPTDEDVDANVVTTEMTVVEDRPFVERVSPHDIFVNPEATRMTDATWIAQRIVKDLEDVRSDKRYKRSFRRNVKPDALLKEEMRAPGSREKDDDYARITVWEYYDLKAGTMCVFTEQGDDFLVEPMPQPYKFGHPFVMLRNYDVPDYFYPMGELEAIEPLQHELNKTRSQQMNDRRRYARKYLARANAFDSNGIAQLQSQKDGAIAFVNEGVELGDAIIPMPQTPLDPSIYQMSDVIQGDINNITAVNEYARGGGAQDIRRTATEASMIQDAANARAADKLAQVEAYISQVARRLIMLSQQYMTEPQVTRVTGGNGAPLWFEFEPSWIQGEYDFEVEGGSTQPENDALRRQQSIDLMQTMGPLLQSGLVNVPEVIKFVLRGFGVKNPAKFLNPLPPVDPATGQPLGMPVPPAGPGGPPLPPDAAGAGPQGPAPGPAGPPPDTLAQLAGQVGLTLTNS
jgi:hypothetical protein